jgi:hypothetical protein
MKNGILCKCVCYQKNSDGIGSTNVQPSPNGGIISLMLKPIKINCLAMLLLSGCFGQSSQSAFIAKYEFEDFSIFKDIDMAFRGTNKQDNFFFFFYVPHLVKDSLNTGYYIVILDKETYHAIETKLTLIKNHVADTVKLQQLAQKFIKYKISRLNVDKQGNVFIYMKNIETLTLVRFVDENELVKYPHKKWNNIKGNWYKPSK